MTAVRRTVSCGTNCVTRGTVTVRGVDPHLDVDRVRTGQYQGFVQGQLVDAFAADLVPGPHHQVEQGAVAAMAATACAWRSGRR